MDDDSESLMRPWRQNDEDAAYPTFELIEQNYARLRGCKPGFNDICVHKGLAPARAWFARLQGRLLPFRSSIEL